MNEEVSAHGAKLETLDVRGWVAAMRGTRLSHRSVAKSDASDAGLGPRDVKLATALVARGRSHRKFLRQVIAWVDVTLPRYAWQEFDTYRFGVEKQSGSTMHSLLSRPVKPVDFAPQTAPAIVEAFAAEVERARRIPPGAARLDALRALKSMLPEGYLQRRVVMISYEAALTMHLQRRDHRLPEWNAKSPGSVCRWVESLPYMTEFLAAAEGERA